MKKIALISAFLLGVNAILSEVILIRELLVHFSGNELSMGIMLAVWLIAGAMGSMLLAGIFINRVKKPHELFAILLSLLSAIIPATLFLSRIIRIILGIPLYELLSPFKILYACTIILLPVSCLLSICFVLCSKMLSSAISEKSGPGLAYVLEALGATAGGAIFTFVLVRYLSSFKIISFLMAVNIAFLIWFSKRTRESLQGISKGNFFSLLLTMPLIGLLLSFSQVLEKESQRLQWQPQQVLSYVNSPYGNITVTRDGESINLYENGSLFFTNQDTAFCEEFTHLIMLQHQDPKKVLLIGGGISGILRQILKHNPAEVTYLELDPSVIDVSKAYISENDKSALSDKCVRIINQDGRFFIKRARDRYDLIIVSLPDPTTLQLNRFYTAQFYQQARACLGKDGIFACRISSGESIISNELARYNASVYKSLKSSFSSVGLIPGENLIFIASDDSRILNDRPQILVDRFLQRKIETDFLTEYHIRDRYYPYAIDYIKKRLKGQYDNAISNSDFRPISFYYDIVLWGVRFYPKFVGLLSIITNIKTMHILALVLIFLLAGAMLVKVKRDSLDFVTPAAIALIGAIGITLEIIIILSFQISYGYVYGRVGFLISLFMLGLGLGGYIMNNSIGRLKDHTKMLSYIMAGFSCYAAVLPNIIKNLSAMPLEAAGILFYPLILFTGAGVGSSFPLGVSILQKKRSAPQAASIIWGTDLLGASVGILVSTLIIIPVLGISDTALICAMLGLAIFILLTLFRRRLQR